MSELKVNKVSPVTGTELTLGDSGDTIDLSTTTVTLPANSVDSDQYVDASIDNAHLADDAVNSDELAAGAVDLAHMSATGTPSSSNFLRGDNSWQEAGGGAWNVITSTNITTTTTSVDFTTGIDSTYRTYALQWEGVVSNTNIDSIKVAFGDSSGFDTGASNYKFSGGYNYNGSAISPQGSSGATYVDMAGIYSGSASGSNMSGQAIFTRPTDGTSFPMFTWSAGCYSHSSEARHGFGTGVRTAAITVDRVQLQCYTGTIARGRFTLYGIAHA